MSLNASLSFSGNAEEALEFYRSALGGKLEVIRFKGSPAADRVPSQWEDKVLYGNLTTSCGIVLEAMDASPECFARVPGNNIALHLDVESEALVRSVFSALAAGGQVTMPVEKTFWSDAFGMLTDKFGIRWMIGVPAAQTAMRETVAVPTS
ncbi:MAG TPA: VOC family protein [Candidatus Baltobacteraceae bacterium]|nr:VOC family protein [Candidatus Baltobacteraceae bacterium]